MRLTVGRAGPASAVPLSAGFFSELVLRDDLARPGPVVEISSRPWPSGSPEVSARRPAPRGFPRPGHGGVVPTGPGVRRRQARRSVPAARPCPAGMLPGYQGSARRARWPQPGARHRASVRAGRFPSPMCRTSDASSAVLRGWIRAQNAARLRMSVRRLLIAARVATWGIPRHLSASRRPSGQAGPAGSASVRSVLPGIRAGLACWSWRLVRAMAAQAIASSRSMTPVRRSARCRLQELARGPDTDPQRYLGTPCRVGPASQGLRRAPRTPAIPRHGAWSPRESH